MNRRRFVGLTAAVLTDQNRSGAAGDTTLGSPRKPRFVTTWGGFGGHPVLAGPICICFDRNGYLWVSATNHRVQQFNTHGAFLQGIGMEGGGDQPGKFTYPPRRRRRQQKQPLRRR